MTTAPSDLLAFRIAARVITGLGAVEVGIVGDGAHQRTGGFHEGVDVLKSIGRYHGPASANVGSSGEDYSARQARDRSGLSLSSSAVDIGSAWRVGGHAAWLRFNNALYREMVDHPERLPALRAINVSLDGKTKRRFDQNSRGAGLISSTDTVDTHTHCEFWRDTEGTRGPTLERIAALMRAAVGGTPESATTGDDDMTPEQWAALARVDGRMAALYYGMEGNPYGQGPMNGEPNQVGRSLARIEAAAAADEVRDTAALAAINGLVAALKAGGGSVDSAPIVAAVNAVRDEARTRFAELLTAVAKAEARAAAAEAEVEQLRHAQHAAALAEADATADQP